jgi:hypothetical protein
MKKLLTALVLLCTASFADFGAFQNPQLVNHLGQQNEVVYLANNLAMTTNQLLNEARRVAGFRVGVRERQALGRIEDLTRNAYQFNDAARRILGGGFDPNMGYYQLRQLLQLLEQSAYYARQALPDLFCNDFLGGPQVPRQFPGGYQQPYPGQQIPGQFPGGPGGFNDPQARFRLEGLMRQADDLIREIQYRL